MGHNLTIKFDKPVFIVYTLLIVTTITTVSIIWRKYVHETI